jgi:thymidylate synthase
LSGLVPGDFIHDIGDAHVYQTHVKPLQDQLHNLPKPFPVCVMFKKIIGFNVIRHTFFLPFSTTLDLCLITLLLAD